MNVHLPKELLRFDIEIRNWVSSAFARGQITVRVHLDQDEALTQQFMLQSATLKELQSGWEKIAAQLGYPKESVSFEFLAAQLATVHGKDPVENEQEILGILKELFHQAAESASQMKEREGLALAKDILQRLNQIEAHVHQIRSLSTDCVQRYREKLTERILEVCTSGPECDERILREVAIYAEKVDITEELTRLSSHISQFRLLLDSQEKSIGRTLDFLTQEINREINTIASKAAESEVSRLTIFVKSELEKIREQIQNIE